MQNLFRLARIQFLSASLALYGLGAFWAILLGAPFSWSRMLLGYLVIFPGHLSVSFSNDYFDVDVDRYGRPAVFTGGSGVLVKHPELRKPARRIALALMLCSMTLACLYQVIYSAPFWFLGYVAVCNLLGWFYSAPPLRLAYRGFGECSTAFTAGCLLPGMGTLVMRGYLSGDGLLFMIPLLLYGLGFILAVEIPDLEADRLGHKQTWVVRKGRGFGFQVVGFLFLAATGFFFVFPWVYSHGYPIDLHILGLFSILPLSTGLVGAFRSPRDQPTAARLVNGIIASLVAFFILTDGYLIYTSVR
jgi:1,4-dihydroxy-2-naphthoate polyprenyltransferase